MSWDATLYANADEAVAGTLDTIVGDWNYTHNTNRMIAKVLTTVGYEMGPAPFWESIPDKPSTAWWDCLNGLSGSDAFKLLDIIVGGLMEAPELFRAMNPDNGWGDYDSLLAVLVEMRDLSVKVPDGAWRVNG